MRQDSLLKMLKSRLGSSNIFLADGLLGLGKKIIATAMIIGHEITNTGHWLTSGG
jgi:hypothetical protein